MVCTAKGIQNHARKYNKLDNKAKTELTLLR